MIKKKKLGRPLQGKTNKKHATCRLEQKTIDKIRKLGGGSFQGGIEKLIRLRWEGE